MSTRQELVEKIKAEVEFTSDAELHDQYDECLREGNNMIEIGRLCFTADVILKNCDEVAYRTGFNDWLDGQDFIEIDGEQYPKDEVEDFLVGLKDDLESAIQEAEESDEESGEETDMTAENAELEEIMKFAREYGI